MTNILKKWRRQLKKGESTPIPNTLLTREEAQRSALAMLKTAAGTN
jgi:hypothetical protein